MDELLLTPGTIEGFCASTIIQFANLESVNVVNAFPPPGKLIIVRMREKDE